MIIAWYSRGKKPEFIDDKARINYNGCVVLNSFLGSILGDAGGVGRKGMVKEYSGSYRIQDIEESERPRERLSRLGPRALSTAELLAILLRVGTQGENAVQMGQRLLNELDGLRGLGAANFDQICNLHGIGPAKAAQIIAAIELGNRLSKTNANSKPTIHSPTDAAELVMYEMGALEQEEVRIALLDTRNHVLNIKMVYRGSIDSSHVRIAEMFKYAIRKNAKSIIVFHNHPSGDPSPSAEDIALTRDLVTAGKLLGVTVLDHIVIGNGKYISLKERGLGFEN